MSSVTGKVARGAAWMLLFKALERSLGFVSTLILVRLLLPADFGLVAMAMSFIAVAELLSAFGFDISLIRQKDATRAHYDTAWTFNVLLGAIICALMIAGAGAVARFYDEPRLTWVVVALSFGPLLAGAENTGVVAFRKELDFGRDFIFLLSKKVAGFVVGIPLAFILQNYWALVIGALASKLVGTIASFVVHPHRPRFTLQEAPSLMSFSRWLLLTNTLNALTTRLSDFIVGRLFGATTLGLFNVAGEFAKLPHSEIASPIFRAVLPGFASVAHRGGEMASAFRNANGLLAMVTIPAAAGIYAIADLLVPTLLGANWIEAIPFLQVLCGYSVVAPITLLMSAVLLADGHARDVALALTLTLVSFVLGCWLLIPPFGAVGCALAFVASTWIALPCYAWLMAQRCRVPVSAFLATSLRPTLASAAMIVAVRALIELLQPQVAATLHLWLLMLGAIALGALTYAAGVLALWALARFPDGAEREVMGQFLRAVRR